MYDLIYFFFFFQQFANYFISIVVLKGEISKNVHAFTKCIRILKIYFRKYKNSKNNAKIAEIIGEIFLSGLSLSENLNVGLNFEIFDFLSDAGGIFTYEQRFAIFGNFYERGYNSDVKLRMRYNFHKNYVRILLNRVVKNDRKEFSRQLNSLHALQNPLSSYFLLLFFFSLIFF